MFGFEARDAARFSPVLDAQPGPDGLFARAFFLKCSALPLFSLGERSGI